MDFIKTSSLRALIELTFQRNWNGLIWMSRKGVIAKRVKTVQTALSRIRASRAEPAEERMFRARPKSSVRLKSRPKFNHPADHITTRETCPAVGQPQPSRSRARPCARAGNKPRGRATYFAYHGRCAVRAGKTSHVRPRNHRPSITVRPHRPTEIIRPRPFRHGHDPTVRPTSRPTVRTPRSTRSRF
ncbi:unnamed protein product [Microthlaspi erraticum]|uniref:Uncharacterized protein n=1 Tax=Microthlaspi erraticum TaxID=1685480 RepID=A0A6D2K169_9BRAS|nr:unnamed protein product [Microthlaspi erraticum]